MPQSGHEFWRHDVPFSAPGGSVLYEEGAEGTLVRL